MARPDLPVGDKVRRGQIRVGGANSLHTPTRTPRRLPAGLFLTLPALTALAGTMLYPVGWTLWLSLNSNETAMTGATHLVGLNNFFRIARNGEFLAALGHTLVLVAISIALELFIGLGIALALHRSLRGTAWLRVVFSLPLMVAPVVGALAFRFIFVDGYGMIDSLAGLFGLEGPLWFANIHLAFATIVVANLWMALPFDILIFVAGLASLPSDPLEAAQVDGASPRQILVRIVIPLLKPVFAIILVIRLADSFRTFDTVYVLTGGGPANSTDMLSTFIYRQMFTAFDFAGGAAAAVLLVLITSLFTVCAVLALRDWHR